MAPSKEKPKNRRPGAAPGGRAGARPSAPAPEPAAPPSRAARLLLSWGTLVLALAVAGGVFYLRSTASRPLVFPSDGEVRLFDTDPYYHLRHARYAADHFPHLLRWDPGLYPSGGPSLYVGLFDLGIAAAALVAGHGHADAALVERVAAWTPPVLAGLGVLALYLMSRLVLGPLGGLLAAGFFLACPGLSASRGLLGYPDHHIAEIFLGFLTVLGLTRCLQRVRAERAGGQVHPPRFRPAVLDALPLSVFLFTWLGAPIYVVLIGVALYLAVTVEIARGATGEDLGFATLRYCFGALLVIVPLYLVLPWMALDPHPLKETFVAVSLLGAGLPVYVLLLGLLRRRGLGPLAAAAAGVGVVAGLMAFGYFFAPEGKFLVEELLGVKTELVREQANVTLETYLYLGSAPAVIGLLAVPLALFDAARRSDRGSALVPVLLAAVIVLLWVRTHDYGYCAAGNLAFLAAYVVVRVARLFRALWPRAILVGLVAGAVAAPMLMDKVVPPQRAAPNLRGLMILDEGWVHALRWVRDHTPKPRISPHDSIPADPGFRHLPGEYGVLAFWDFGHYIAAIAERLPFASGGISTGLAQWFLIEDEEQSIQPERLGMRPGERFGYVMVDARTAADFFMAGLRMADRALEEFKTPYRRADWQGNPLVLWTFGDRYKKTMIGRLYLGEGTGLAHYRLVYESPENSALFFDAKPAPNGTEIARRSQVIDAAREPAFRKIVAHGQPTQSQTGLVYDVSIQPTVKVFEEVAGAVLDGYTEPGVTVEAVLDLRTGASARTIRYTRTVVADAQGHYLLTVPYPSEPRPEPDTDVTATGPYVVRSAGKTLGQVTVRTADVRAGARLVVPTGT